jgi:hypothetical protein
MIYGAQSYLGVTFFTLAKASLVGSWIASDDDGSVEDIPLDTSVAKEMNYNYVTKFKILSIT